MKRIPTVFVTKDDKLTNEITPGCEWVFDPDVQVVPRRMYDGITMLLEDEKWSYRRRIKPGRAVPETFTKVDEFDGAQYGWVSVEEAFSYYKHFDVARQYDPYEAELRGIRDVGYSDGTYELVGPRIAGGKDKTGVHRLVRHNTTEIISNVPDALSASFEGIRDAFSYVDIKGVVWYDLEDPGRLAKLTKADFGFKW